MKHEIPLRITLVQPPPGVTFRLQRGRTELVEPAREGEGEVVFELTIAVADGAPDAPPRLLGDFTQGPPQNRFVYVNSGTLAGEPNSCWTRRAKVPLRGITRAMIEMALAAGAVLEARIAGRAKDGGPVCASIPLLDGGWRVVKRAAGGT